MCAARSFVASAAKSFEPGERIWIGVDVGGERSPTAVAWPNEQRQVGVAIFHGESGGQKLAERGIMASSYPQTDEAASPWGE